MNRYAARITDGSVLLARRARTAVADWIADGRRADLKGWRAAAGPVARAAAVLLGAYVAARIVRAVPGVLWLLTPAWVVAACRVTRLPPEDEGAVEPPAKAPPDPRRAFAEWLLQTIGNRPGIHLYELYPAMRQLPGHEGLDDTALRGALRTLGVVVDRSVRVPPVEGRSGVYRHKVAALLSPAESGIGERHGDAGQAADSPVLSAAGEGAESA